MEITVKVTGLDHLADAIMALAKVTGEKTANVGFNSQEKESTETKSVPVTEQPVSVPVSAPINQAPVQPAPQSGVVPTATVTATYTMEQLAVAMTGLIDAGKMQQVQSILSSFGVQTLMEVPQERYGELAGKMKECGAVM